MTHALVGSPAPDFKVTDQHGRRVALADFRGTRVLLVFLPFAFSDTCTNELVDLRDADDLRGGGEFVPLVMSCDSIYTLRAWGDTHGYQGQLLSDFWPHGEVARAYGVFNPHKGLAMRGTFLIDAQGTCEWAVVNESGQARDLDDYRAALQLIG